MTTIQEKSPGLVGPDGMIGGVTGFESYASVRTSSAPADIFPELQRPESYVEPEPIGPLDRRASVGLPEPVTESAPRTRRFGLNAGSVVRGLSVLGRLRRSLVTTPSERGEVVNDGPVAVDEPGSEGLLGAYAPPVPTGFDAFATEKPADTGPAAPVVASLPPVEIFGEESAPNERAAERVRRQDLKDRSIANINVGLRALGLTAAAASLDPASGGYHAPSYHGARPENAGVILPFDVSMDVIGSLRARGNHRAADEEVREAIEVADRSPLNYRQARAVQVPEVHLDVTTAEDALVIDDMPAPDVPPSDGRWSLRDSGLRTEDDKTGDPFVQRVLRGLLAKTVLRNRA